MGNLVNETVTQSEESITLMTPYGVLSIYLLTVADPSRSFRMTFNVSLIMTLFHPIVILNGVRMPYEKDEKRNSGME